MTWTDAFNAWLSDEGIKDTWLAYRVGVSAVAVHYWKHGSIPNERRRQKIESLSNGRVRAAMALKKTGS